MVESSEPWTLKPKLRTCQVWTLIHLINSFVYAKSSKLITLEEHLISLPLFFVFSSEVLNSGIKKLFWRSCFSRRSLPRNVLMYVFGVFTFRVVCYCFYEGFIPKIILASWFCFFSVSLICSKFLDLTLESSVIHLQCPY